MTAFFVRVDGFTLGNINSISFDFSNLFIDDFLLPPKVTVLLPIGRSTPTLITNASNTANISSSRRNTFFGRPYQNPNLRPYL